MKGNLIGFLLIGIIVGLSPELLHAQKFDEEQCFNQLIASGEAYLNAQQYFEALESFDLAASCYDKLPHEKSEIIKKHRLATKRVIDQTVYTIAQKGQAIIAAKDSLAYREEIKAQAKMAVESANEAVRLSEAAEKRAKAAQAHAKEYLKEKEALTEKLRKIAEAEVKFSQSMVAALGTKEDGIKLHSFINAFHQKGYTPTLEEFHSRLVNRDFGERHSNAYRILPHDSPVLAVKFAPKNKYVVTVTPKGLYKWTLDGYPHPTHENLYFDSSVVLQKVNHVAISNEEVIALVYNDFHILVHTNSETWNKKDLFPSFIQNIQIRSKFILVGCLNRKAYVFDLEKKRIVDSLTLNNYKEKIQLITDNSSKGYFIKITLKEKVSPLDITLKSSNSSAKESRAFLSPYNKIFFYDIGLDWNNYDYITYEGHYLGHDGKINYLTVCDGFRKGLKFGKKPLYFATASDDHTAKIWEYQHHPKVQEIEHSVDADFYAFFPDINYLLLHDYISIMDVAPWGNLEVWSPYLKQKKSYKTQKFKNQKIQIESSQQFAVLPDDKNPIFIQADDSGVLRPYKKLNKKLRYTKHHVFTNQGSNLVFANQNNQLASIDLYELEIETNQDLKNVMPLVLGTTQNSFACIIEKGKVNNQEITQPNLFISKDGGIRNFKRVCTLDDKKLVYINPDGDCLIAALNKEYYLINLVTDQIDTLQYTLKQPTFMFLNDSLIVEIQSQANRLVVKKKNGTLVKINDQKEITYSQFMFADDGSSLLYINKDSSRLFYTALQQNNSTASFHLVNSVSRAEFPYEKVVLSPNGKFIATISKNNYVSLFDAVSFFRIANFDVSFPKSLHFSDDSEYLYVQTSWITSRLYNIQFLLPSYPLPVLHHYGIYITPEAWLNDENDEQIRAYHYFYLKSNFKHITKGLKEDEIARYKTVLNQLKAK